MATVIQLLGRPGIQRPGGRGPRPRGRKTWALLALASLSERPVARHQLVRMLFPGADDAPAALRWVRSELRRGLRPDASVDGDPVALGLSTGTVVDAQLELRGQIGGVVEAGELLAGFALPDCPEFELWLAHQRDRVSTALQAHTLVIAERWTAYLPIVLAISAELDLYEDRFDAAGEKLTAAWMTAIRLADPCWLAVTGRGLGLLAARRGNPAEAMQWLDGAYHQTSDQPLRVCRWIDAATLDAICEVATTFGLPRADSAAADLAGLSRQARMPVHAARARAHQARRPGGPLHPRSGATRTARPH